MTATSSGIGQARQKPTMASLQQRIQAATMESWTTSCTPIDDVSDYDKSYHLGVELFGGEAKVVEHNMQDKLKALETDVEAVLRASGNQNTDDQQNANPQQAGTLQLVRANIQFLRECSQARAVLDASISLSTPALSPETTQLVRSSQLYLEAEVSLRQAESIIDQASEKVTSYGTAAVATLLKVAVESLEGIRHSLQRQKLHLIQLATAVLDRHISTIDSLSESLSVREGKELGEALDVLQTMEKDKSTLYLVLNTFTKSLYQHVIHPLVEAHRQGQKAFVMEFSSQQTAPHRWSKKIDNVFEWSRIEESDSTLTGIRAWKPTFLFLRGLVEFVADHVLLNRPQLCEMFGKQLFGEPGKNMSSLSSCDVDNLWNVDWETLEENGGLVDQLMRALQDTCLPCELQSSELGQLRVMSDQLQFVIDPFLSVVKAKSISVDSLQPIASFPSEFESNYVNNRMRLHLGEARKLILENDYHATIQVGDLPTPDKENLPIETAEDVFLLHRASVSTTAFETMQKCRTIMDEVAALPRNFSPDNPLSRMSIKLHGTAHHVFGLFRAIIPVTHGHEIATLPRAAAVMHNDCVFLAQHCLTLGLEYRDKTPSSLDEEDKGKDGVRLESFLFVDLVPLFRELADQSLRNMLDVQASKIIVKVDLANMKELLVLADADWSQFGSSVAKGVHHLRHLANTLTPVLATPVLNKSLTYLADVLLHILLEQLLSSPKLQHNAVEFLQALCSKTLQDIQSILTKPSSSNVWKKFVAVSCFLGCNDIAAGLTAGSFASLTTSELSSLVNSTVVDAERRHNILQRLDPTAAEQYAAEETTLSSGGTSKETASPSPVVS